MNYSDVVCLETPGPKIGFVLLALLEEVLENPDKNNEEYLDSRTNELILLDLAQLQQLADQGKQTRDEFEDVEVKKLHAKHQVSK